MKTFFSSVNASGASGPSSRPRPDCLNPPNGVQYRTDEWEFTDRFPVSTALATRIAALCEACETGQITPGRVRLSKRTQELSKVPHLKTPPPPTESKPASQEPVAV